MLYILNISFLLYLRQNCIFQMQTALHFKYTNSKTLAIGDKTVDVFSCLYERVFA